MKKSVNSDACCGGSKARKGWIFIRGCLLLVLAVGCPWCFAAQMCVYRTQCNWCAEVLDKGA